MARITLLLLLSLSILTSCNPYISQRELYVADYRAGNFDAADIQITALINKNTINELLWLKLDRGLERFVAGDTKGAIDDFNAALVTLDYYNEVGFMETFGKGLFCDSASPYRGDDFEQLLARIYFAIALLHEGDESNAYAVLRQAEEWSQSKKEDYAKSPATASFAETLNPVSKILFASLLEKQNDKSNAQLLFEQAGFNFQGTGPATVLVICHNGNAPFKVSRIAPGSQASLIALEMLAIPYDQRAYCNMAGVPVPRLLARPFSCGSDVTASLDNTCTPLLPIFNIENAAEQELKQKEPFVIARGAARIAARRAAVLAAQQHDPNLGPWVDLGMLIANIATQADIRSWSLLPRQIEMARFDVEPGSYTLTLNIASSVPHAFEGIFTSRLKLKKGDLCIINIFNIQPGVTRVLIPNRFQENQ